jgi:hypothetical protein
MFCILMTYATCFCTLITYIHIYVCVYRPIYVCVYMYIFSYPSLCPGKCLIGISDWMMTASF